MMSNIVGPTMLNTHDKNVVQALFKQQPRKTCENFTGVAGNDTRSMLLSHCYLPDLKAKSASALNIDRGLHKF